MLFNDDDTIANPNSLEKLIKPLDQIENVGFLASNVRWTNGAPSVMNVPALSNNWNQYSQKGYLQIKTASFVSVLFPRYVVYEVGLPISDFFIWCDDTEYTSRITKAGFKNYFVSESCITHKMAQNVGIDITKENNKSRITRYFLRNRNSLFMFKELGGVKQVIKELYRQMRTVIKLIFSKSTLKWFKIITLLKGTILGLLFNARFIIKLAKYF